MSVKDTFALVSVLRYQNGLLYFGFVRDSCFDL